MQTHISILSLKPLSKFVFTCSGEMGTSMAMGRIHIQIPVQRCSIVANSKIVRHMDGEFVSIQMDLDSQENGTLESNMDLATRFVVHIQPIISEQSTYRISLQMISFRCRTWNQKTLVLQLYVNCCLQEVSLSMLSPTIRIRICESGLYKQYVCPETKMSKFTNAMPLKGNCVWS